ncbi:hypothetical protein PPROV_000406600 [Pycnococcus provasolii]|uniref:Uncharacterized protein n=1 Tax=Pycnococcus provasolii TaxID=41880 RepID=A0A830HE30_9CHLO|nr:hypothetical protein PPROV_000406600 [Pycnococcus provasolii]
MATEEGHALALPTPLPNPFPLGTTKQAAYEVLRVATEEERRTGLPLEEFVTRIRAMRKADRGMWPANTKTPDGTLSAAMGGDACFLKTMKRTFTLSGAAPGKVDGYGVRAHPLQPPAAREREHVDDDDPNAPKTSTGRRISVKKRTYEDIMEAEHEARVEQAKVRAAAKAKEEAARKARAKEEEKARRIHAAQKEQEAKARRKQVELARAKLKAQRLASSPTVKVKVKAPKKPASARGSKKAAADSDDDETEEDEEKEEAAPTPSRGKAGAGSKTPKVPTVFDMFPYTSKTEVLSGLDSPLQAIDISDVVNADTLASLDEESRNMLATLASDVDVNGRLFNSPSWKETLTLYQELLAMGLFDTKSGQPRRIVEMYQELRKDKNALRNEWCSRLYANRRASGRHSAVSSDLLSQWEGVDEAFREAMNAATKRRREEEMRQSSALAASAAAAAAAAVKATVLASSPPM